MSSTKQKLFLRLANETSNCVICPDLADKNAVLSNQNGNINPRVLFVAEAPGRQGADRTRRPFWGDKSGENFQVLLDSINLSREDIFITNAVLCSPRKPSGANRKPKKSEVNNCSNFLRRTIELIVPRIVVPLGIVALDALNSIEYHGLILKDSVAKPRNWYGATLIPLYHPSPQVFASNRRLEQQLADYQTLGKALDAVKQ